jgi:hypothetical protein
VTAPVIAFSGLVSGIAGASPARTPFQRYSGPLPVSSRAARQQRPGIPLFLQGVGHAIDLREFDVIAEPVFSICDPAWQFLVRLRHSKLPKACSNQPWLRLLLGIDLAAWCAGSPNPVQSRAASRRSSSPGSS